MNVCVCVHACVWNPNSSAASCRKLSEFKLLDSDSSHWQNLVTILPLLHAQANVSAQVCHFERVVFAPKTSHGKNNLLDQFLSGFPGHFYILSFPFCYQISDKKRKYVFPNPQVHKDPPLCFFQIRSPIRSTLFWLILEAKAADSTGMLLKLPCLAASLLSTHSLACVWLLPSVSQSDTLHSEMIQ